MLTLFFVQETKRLVWRHRLNWLQRPEALPKVLLSAQWSSLSDVISVRR
jgi:hypothetical protein